MGRPCYYPPLHTLDTPTGSHPYFPSRQPRLTPPLSLSLFPEVVWVWERCLRKVISDWHRRTTKFKSPDDHAPNKATRFFEGQCHHSSSTINSCTPRGVLNFRTTLYAWIRIDGPHEGLCSCRTLKRQQFDLQNMT